MIPMSSHHEPTHDDPAYHASVGRDRAAGRARGDDGRHVSGAPPVVLDDPSPALARRTVEQFATAAGLSAERVAGLRLAVSEIVTNAHLHGRPPVQVRAWTSGDDVVVSVRDAGRGPRTALGDVATPPSPLLQSGRGWWISQRSVDSLEARRDRSGFEVRLVAGRSHSSRSRSGRLDGR